MKAKPFFTFITLFGISLTIAFLVVVGSIIDTSYGSYGLEKRMDQILIAKKLEVDRENGYSSSLYSYSAYKDYFSKMKTPEEIVLMNDKGWQKLYYQNLAEKVHRKAVGANFFKIFDFELINGRFFTEEDRKQERALAIITDELASTLFGTEDPIGKTLRISSRDFEVFGVVEKGNSLRNFSYADVYTPYQIEPSWGGNMSPFLGNYTMFLYFKDKESVENGRAEFESVVKTLPLNKDNEEVGIKGICLKYTEDPLYNLFQIQSSSAFYGVIFTVIILFMSLPAFNLININITRMLERSGEIGVRKAFGASISDLVVQLMVENTVITLIGGIIGFVLATIGVVVINYYQLLNADEFLEMNPMLFVFGLSITLLFSLFSGAYPAFKMSSFEIISSLKSAKQ